MGMSNQGLGCRDDGLYKATLRRSVVRNEPSPLLLRRLKSQHHENSSSISTTHALSVSCTPHSSIPSLIMFLGFTVLVSTGRSAIPPSLSERVFRYLA